MTVLVVVAGQGVNVSPGTVDTLAVMHLNRQGVDGRPVEGARCASIGGAELSANGFSQRTVLNVTFTIDGTVPGVVILCG